MMISRVFARLKDDRGLTLTEVMIAVMLLTIVGLVFTNVMASSLLATEDLAGAARSNDEMRLVIQTIDRELRGAERICQPTPGNDGNVLEFRTRAYAGTPPPSGYRDVTYQLAADAGGNLTILQKSTDGGTTWRTVVEHVRNDILGVSLFTNQGNVATALPSQGKVITVEIWIDGDLLDNIGAQVTTTEIAGRNIWTPNAAGC